MLLNIYFSSVNNFAATAVYCFVDRTNSYQNNIRGYAIYLSFRFCYL